MSKKGDYLIPFDKDGNQLHYADQYDVARKGVVMCNNYQFEDTLTYVGYLRGCSAAYFEWERSNGKTVVMFLTSLDKAMPYITNGKIAGKFTFEKRGMNYGTRLLEGR